MFRQFLTRVANYFSLPERIKRADRKYLEGVIEDLSDLSPVEACEAMERYFTAMGKRAKELADVSISLGPAETYKAIEAGCKAGAQNMLIFYKDFSSTHQMLQKYLKEQFHLVALGSNDLYILSDRRRDLFNVDIKESCN
jgi:mRNA degradation ribonuclease J1/J2